MKHTAVAGMLQELYCSWEGVGGFHGLDCSGRTEDIVPYSQYLLYDDQSGVDVRGLLEVMVDHVHLHRFVNFNAQETTK